MTRGVKFGQSVPAPASAPCCLLLLQEDGTQVFVRQTETPAEKRATHNPENDSGRRMQGVSAARPLSVAHPAAPSDDAWGCDRRDGAMQAIARLFLRPTHLCSVLVGLVASRPRWPGQTQGLELCGCFNPPADNSHGWGKE